MCDIWINVLLQTSALVGQLHIVNWNAWWNSEIIHSTSSKFSWVESNKKWGFANVWATNSELVAQNVSKRSRLDAAVCLRKFLWILSPWKLQYFYSTYPLIGIPDGGSHSLLTASRTMHPSSDTFICACWRDTLLSVHCNKFICSSFWIYSQILGNEHRIQKLHSQRSELSTLFTKSFRRCFVWQARQASHIFLIVTKIFSWIKWQILKLFFVSSVTFQLLQPAEETTSSRVLTYYWYAKCHYINSNKTKLIQRATFKRQLHTYAAHMENIPAEKHLHLEHLFE
jgi:hypothetical protein